MKNQMCTSLACRISANDPGCVYLSGNGAISGTVCGSEQVENIIFIFFCLIYMLVNLKT